MAYQAADTIAEQLSASVLTDTERGAFLNSEEFGTAFDAAVLQSSVYQQLVASGQNPTAAEEMAAGSYLYSSGGDSAFAVASREFVASTTGSIIPIVPQADLSKIFGTDEVPAMLALPPETVIRGYGTVADLQAAATAAKQSGASGT